MKKVLNLLLIVFYSSNIKLIEHPAWRHYPPPSCLPRDHIAPWKIGTSEPALYRCVAGVEPSDVQVTETKSVKWLWWNLPLSSGLVETKDHSQKGERSL